MAQEVLPKPPPAFTGTIDPSRQKSHPAWPGDETPFKFTEGIEVVRLEVKSRLLVG